MILLIVANATISIKIELFKEVSSFILCGLDVVVTEELDHI